MAARHQVRLLLWKEYLVRKRNLITLGGIIWATAIMFSLYIVRANIDNTDYPTCQFQARALPSAGLLTFLQSFICNINNECLPMDQFKSIPTYENSRFTQLQRQFTPLLYNDSVLDAAATVPDALKLLSTLFTQLQRQFTPLLYNDSVLDAAATVPDALKLLSTLADVVDQPTFLDITKNGLKVRDLFRNPTRVRRYLSKRLTLPNDVTNSIMTSQLSLQGVFKGEVDRCSSKSISETVLIKNDDHLMMLTASLCKLSDDEAQKIMFDVLLEIDFSKFIKMIGEMYSKLSGDGRLTVLGDTITAVLRIMNIQSFIPNEIYAIVKGETADFTYFDLDLIPKLLDLFKPTFGDTTAYINIRDLADTAVVGAKYLYQFFGHNNTDFVEETNITEGSSDGLNDFTKGLSRAVDAFKSKVSKQSSGEVFKVLSKVTNFIHKWLPKDLKDDVLFYSTLLAKLIESANNVIKINVNIEKIAQESSLRHPEGVRILTGLPKEVIAKGFDALADTERIQIFTSKVNTPDKIFCDVKRIQGFFQMSKAEAESLQKQLCVNSFNDYIADLVKSFGVYDVKNSINSMASLLIQKTLGKDTRELLYSIDKDFEIVSNFTQSLLEMTDVKKSNIDWKTSLNISGDSEFMKVAKEKSKKATQTLINIHGTLAKEIVTQNTILTYKISPIFIDATFLLVAINEQIDLTPKDLIARFKLQYPDIFETFLLTLLNEDKTYKSLSTHNEDVFCNGGNSTSYLQFKDGVDQEEITNTLCEASSNIEQALSGNSVLSKAIKKLTTTTQKQKTINWNLLINSLKSLYTKLEGDFPYLFKFKTYGMEEEKQKEIEELIREVTEFWFGNESFERSTRLSLKLLFQLLEFMDHDMFDLTHEFWLQIKYIIQTLTGYLTVFDDTVKLVVGISRNESVVSPIPLLTVQALTVMVPSAPQLVIDAADIVTRDDIDIQPIISLLNTSPAWPCATASLSDLLPLSDTSKPAIKAIETMLCMDENFQQEWTDYLNRTKFDKFNWRKWNTTTFEQHIFLKFSATFDYVLNDTIALKDVLTDAFNETSQDSLNLAKAWKYAVSVVNRNDSQVFLRNFFTKADTIINAINTSVALDELPLNQMWEKVSMCSNGNKTDVDCRDLTRATWKYTINFLSVVLKNMAEDLLTYFTEVNEPDSNPLQLLGFTRNTGLYILYNRMTEFLAVIINSYMDYGFMSQVRRATETKFWDCEAITTALVPPPGSPIDGAIIKKVQPFVCPSLFHWISLPRGDNIILDVVTKPQYFFYTIPADNLTSAYETAYVKGMELLDFMSDMSKQNKTLIPAQSLDVKTLDEKLKRTVKNIMTFEVDVNNKEYRQFYDINKKQASARIYLARIVAIVDKLAKAISEININNVNISEDEKKSLESDVSIVKRAFGRRPSEVICLHFDVLTYLLWNSKDNFDLVGAFEVICDDSKNNITSKDLLQNFQRTKTQICAKNFTFIYRSVENDINADFFGAKESLVNLVKVLQDSDDVEKADVFEALQARKQLIDSLRKSVSYAYEMSTPIYLQYLQSDIRHYDIILSILSGSDWWNEMRRLYNGNQATMFFNTIERSFEIAEDVIGNLDRIHLVRLLRDINLNDTDVFCQTNVTLSDYFPDGAGLLSDFKKQMCDSDRIALFNEIPPLKFASQGFEDELQITNKINYTTLNQDIKSLQNRLDSIRDGPKKVQRPLWISDDKIKHLTGVADQLLSKESLTRTGFGVLGNVVDAGTLFLNGSHCTLCSKLTAWFKQINLQLFKKQEYDSLLCQIHDMKLEDVHLALKNNFHWDMAIQELILTRNYTKYELNKSMNEFLEQVKLHLMDDITRNATKLSECLTRNVTHNAVGNVALFTKVLAYTTKLIRSEIPHIREINGISRVEFFKTLQSQISHNIDVYVPLEEYIQDGKKFKEELTACINDEGMVDDIEKSEINLKMVNNIYKVNQYLKLDLFVWDDICQMFDCSRIDEIIGNHLNKTQMEMELPNLQNERFWRFDFVSTILYHIEQLLQHGARIIGGASGVDLQGVVEGRIAAMLDLMIQVLDDDVMNSILYSLRGIIEELHPFLSNTSLEVDLKSLADGLTVMSDFKHYLLDNVDLKLKVSDIFSHPERIESELNSLGINNTNFWSLAAPKIQLGYINLKPLLSKQSEHISDYVCRIDSACLILDVGIDACEAIVGQYCSLSDDIAAQTMAVLIHNVNFTYVFEKVSQKLLTQLYSASNLTASEGASVLESFPKMAALLPVVQENVGNLTAGLAKEPLLESFKNFDTIGGLLTSQQFLSSAGNMMCGKPFSGGGSRFYKAIADAKDFSNEPDPRQLEVLPSDFCRSLYKDVLKMSGGKIVWSFVKPLIMGKILYTPSTGYVQRIVEKANATFAHMQRLTNIIHSFANAFYSIDKLAQHKQGVEVLKRLMTSNDFSEIRDMLVGKQDLEFDVDVDGLFDEFGDLKDIGTLLRRASNLLSCVNLDRFRAVSDEQTLAHEAVALTTVNEFSAGLVFLNASNQDSMPKNIEYKIRMDIESVPTTSRIRNQFWIPGPESSFLENMRYFRGFIQIQDLVDRAIIQLSNIKRQKRDGDIGKNEMQDYDVYTQQMPYPCYRKDYFQTTLYESQALIVAFFFSLLFSVASAVRFIVTDKENGNTMLLSVMGVDPTSVTLAWFIATFIEMLVTCACVTLALYFGGILPNTNMIMLFLLLVIFGFSVIMFCYMLSKLFKTASFGAVCSAIAYLVTFMPYVLILSLEALLSHAAKLCACLSMSSAFSYSMLYIARFEAIGEGSSWDKLWVSPGGDDRMSIGLAACMMIVDGLIYLAVGCVLERFYGYKSVSSNITYSQSIGEKAGVSIVNVSKVYGNSSSKTRHKALDNVALELHSGQVTTLLGHNGAGKTTLINILTGMSAPTSGGITIRNSSVTNVHVGVCPQRDVLWPYLTAREHVVLHAEICSRGKGMEGEVESMMRVLELGNDENKQTRALSGGARRRLCCALAFLSSPGLVSLDEPSAGVDPRHHREIWSLIMKLKENRTILLTTHHLDEAELLSDQVVIMHKGQIHTIGSPVEIKRALGNGYKLTVTYPKQSGFDTTIEERTKVLLSMVREIVKNAQLVDQNGGQVEICLPYFDADGVSNDFLTVCETLELCQDSLGFSDLMLESSTLEQIFFSICQRADDDTNGMYGTTSSNSSLETVKKSTDSESTLVPYDDVTPSHWQHFIALMKARYLHYTRNIWLLFLLLGLPSLFVLVSMSFSMIRPPPDNEVALPLHPGLYQHATEFVVPNPAVYSDAIDPSFAMNVMKNLQYGTDSYRNWTIHDSPICNCSIKQECDLTNTTARPEMMVLPNVDTLNDWLIASHSNYIENRYGGFTSALLNNKTHFISWYNNKGHHAMPSYLSAVNSAILKHVTGDSGSNITTYTHPLKISTEQLSKSTLLQHVADAGISCMLLVAFSLVTAGGAIFVTDSRVSKQKRLHLLCGVQPWLYSLQNLAWDLMIMLINVIVTVCILEAFGFPVFVARNNLPAICLLLILFGYACASLVHLLERGFSEPSLANMILFCANVFIGLAGITILLILDIISESEATDNARWRLHKVFLCFPQFVLADGLLEIAKNTIQAQVLERFGMDTYKDPLASDLISLHYLYLVLVGTCLFAINLAIEYDCGEVIMSRLRKPYVPPPRVSETEDVLAERERVRETISQAQAGLVRLHTIGNINAGFIDTEEIKRKSLKRMVSLTSDVAACVDLTKVHRGSSLRPAVDGLTLGIPRGQCLALLGENGAGKSTTFSMLCGETRPTSGVIYLHDKPATPRSLCNGDISYCPQNNAIDVLMTVEETLQLYCRLRGIQQQEEVIKRTLSRFDLCKYSEVRAGALSGGNKRKLCTAIAFMGRSQLVLLDEPTTGMDPGARMLLSGDWGARGVLLCTHVLGDAVQLASRVALLREGRLKAVGTTRDCLARFGGGYMLCMRSSNPRALLHAVLRHAPHARVHAASERTLHVLLPARYTVNGKEMSYLTSEVLRLVSQLQADCDVQDYTINQSSLDQMFLNEDDKTFLPLDMDLEPSPQTMRRNDQETDITSL